MELPGYLCHSRVTSPLSRCRICYGKQISPISLNNVRGRFASRIQTLLDARGDHSSARLDDGNRVSRSLSRTRLGITERTGGLVDTSCGHHLHPRRLRPPYSAATKHASSVGRETVSNERIYARAVKWTGSTRMEWRSTT
jgi:hypothetical protein